jgi:pentatricopeptide repeat protein
MHLPTALELVHEMRQRNVSPNTHTYSSMLNVCVKAGELDLALDVFSQVQRFAVVPCLGLLLPRNPPVGAYYCIPAPAHMQSSKLRPTPWHALCKVEVCGYLARRGQGTDWLVQAYLGVGLPSFAGR